MVVMTAGPPTHISVLANLHKEYCIQMVNPMDLFHAVDCSTDLPEHMSMDEYFGELLATKYENCTEWYLTNLATLGVQEPVVVIIRSDGRWQMDEGHHRLAWAIYHEIPFIPVIFDDSGADDDSVMGFLVARADAEVYHCSTGDFLRSQAETLAFGAVVGKSKKVFIPRPRRGGRHRA